MKLDPETIAACLAVLKRHGLDRDYCGSKAIQELRQLATDSMRVEPKPSTQKNGHK